MEEDARCCEEDLWAFEVNAGLLDEEGAIWMLQSEHVRADLPR